jgi:hypothetical protein
MTAHNGATSRRREFGIRVAIISAAVVAAMVVVPLGTLAARGGNSGAGGTTEYSTIGLASDTARVAETGMTRGSSVSFTTNVVNLKGSEWAMVYVACYSDVDGRLLYGELATPDSTFVLGGGSSDWWLLEPAPAATCYAHLWAYGGREKGVDTIRTLTDPSQPTLSFHAG